MDTAIALTLIIFIATVLLPVLEIFRIDVVATLCMLVFGRFVLPVSPALKSKVSEQKKLIDALHLPQII